MQPEEQREVLRTVHSLRPRYPSHKLSPQTFVCVGYDMYIVIAYISQLARLTGYRYFLQSNQPTKKVPSLSVRYLDCLG